MREQFSKTIPCSILYTRKRDIFAHISLRLNNFAPTKSDSGFLVLLFNHFITCLVRLKHILVCFSPTISCGSYNLTIVRGINGNDGTFSGAFDNSADEKVDEEHGINSTAAQVGNSLTIGLFSASTSFPKRTPLLRTFRQKGIRGSRVFSLLEAVRVVRVSVFLHGELVTDLRLQSKRWTSNKDVRVAL